MRAFMREVHVPGLHPIGAVLLPFHGLPQDVTPVRIPGSGSLRNSALVGIPVHPLGSGLAFNEEELPVVDVLLPVRVQQVPVEAPSLWQRLEIRSGLWSRRLSSLQGLPGYLPRLPSDQVRARILGGPVVPRYLRRVPVQPVRLWWKFLSQSSRSSITFVSSSVFVLLVTL